MKCIKRWFFRPGAVKRVSGLLLLFCCLVPPVASYGACTEVMAETLVRQNLDMRLRFLRGSKRMPVYEAAAAEESARILQFIADKNWGGVCKSVYLVIGIADDVLAGGDGKTKPLRKPWNQCTPERMFALEGEYDVICRPDRRIDNCSRRALMPPRREAVKLKSLANTGNIDPARYVDRMCDLYTELLRILRE